MALLARNVLDKKPTESRGDVVRQTAQLARELMLDDFADEAVSLALGYDDHDLTQRFPTLGWENQLPDSVARIGSRLRAERAIYFGLAEFPYLQVGSVARLQLGENCWLQFHSGPALAYRVALVYENFSDTDFSAYRALRIALLRANTGINCKVTLSDAANSQAVSQNIAQGGACDVDFRLAAFNKVNLAALTRIAITLQGGSFMQMDFVIQSLRFVSDSPTAASAGIYGAVLMPLVGKQFKRKPQ